MLIIKKAIVTTVAIAFSIVPRVFNKVLATQPQAQLLLVSRVESLALGGEDAKQYWDKVHQLVTELNLSHTVHFTGYLSDEALPTYPDMPLKGVLAYKSVILT